MKSIHPDRSPADPLSRRARVVLTCLLAALTALLGVTLAGFTPAPAQAARLAPQVGCWGDWCSGQNPETTGCSADAYTVVHARIPGTWTNVELRWSPTCKTNWARVAASWGTSYPSQLQAVQQSTGYSQIGVIGSNTDYAWTGMIYSPTKCVYAAWVGPPGTVSTSCA